MNHSKNNIIKATSIGLITLVIFVTCCFFLRWTCDSILQEEVAHGGLGVRISPSRLFPTLDAEPNIAELSFVSWSVWTDHVLKVNLGAVRHFEETFADTAEGPESALGSISSDVCYYGYEPNMPGMIMVYFDPAQRLFVRSQLHKTTQRSTFKWTREILAYAGPNGIATTPDESLGRFGTNLLKTQINFTPIFVFDGNERRFYEIDFPHQDITRGAEIPLDSGHDPIRIGFLDKSSLVGNLRWGSPRRRKSNRYSTAFSSYGYSAGINTLFVLDRSGRLDKLDRETMSLTATAAAVPLTFLDNELDDLASYSVLPIYARDTLRGMAVAVLFRDLNIAHLSVFDPNGILIATDSAISSWGDHPGGPLMVVCGGLLEQLHPPLLRVISSVARSHIAATDGYRALFILPNSTIARLTTLDIIERIFQIIAVISPGFLLAVFLASRVVRNAKLLGLSRQQRKAWMIATVLLGIPAYITYRLTRPRETLVTCQNCGKLRCPSHELCHNCQSKWSIPELTAPTWRILDGG